MTPNFEESNYEFPPQLAARDSNTDEDSSAYTEHCSHNAEIDRFELLSAYLDGELAPQERQQVQQWLDNDPEYKQIYTSLLKLQGGLQNLSVPTSIAHQQLSDRVFEQLNRRHSRKRLFLWGTGAIAAVFLATVSGWLPNNTPSSWQLVKSGKQNFTSKPLMVAVAVNKPAVKIPKAAVSLPPQVLTPSEDN